MENLNMIDPIVISDIQQTNGHCFDDLKIENSLKSEIVHQLKANENFDIVDNLKTNDLKSVPIINAENISAQNLSEVHSSVFAAPVTTAPKFIKPAQRGVKLEVTSDKNLNEHQDKVIEDTDIDNKDNKLKSVEFPYKPPLWGGLPEKHYFITILKDGLIKDTITLEFKSHLTFGRFNTCDVFLEHPSCSRYHAVIQYCALEEGKRKKGFYLFDLGSTHGTFLNKEKIKPKVYSRIRVGYQLKFGGSSRLYIIEGPNEDQEEEIDIDILRKRMLEYEQHKKSFSKPQTLTQAEILNDSDQINEDEGATWGFGEDATDEGINLKELFEKKKDIEIKDPKKTLKGFFEREGLELEYEMTEKGSGSSLLHIAQIRLPIDVGDADFVIAEGSSSNKKDAILNCANDACKIIQAYDMLQNKSREDHKRKRQRELEENDFYNSDEDTFLDRTGLIEKKRLKRKQWAGKKEKEEVETFQSLQIKVAAKEKELHDCEEKLSRNKKFSEEVNDEDSLDAYMETMSNSLDANTKMNLKRNVLILRKEIASLKALVEKARPASLPALMETKTFTLPELSMERAVNQIKEKELDIPLHNQKAAEFKQQTTVEEKKVEESIKNINYEQKVEKSENKSSKTTKTNKKKKIYSVSNKDPDFAEWLPPEGQVGDGRTHLNEKFGY
uniref:Kanadaptin n=1 Tax=Hydra vulgaris TaxID=6087 RepID=T2M5Q3_HYDVU